MIIKYALGGVGVLIAGVGILATRRVRLRVFIMLLSTGAALLVAEIGVRILTPFPINTTSNMVPDQYLGYRVDPRHNEIDEAGFRNPGVPNEAQVVALDDSHTFGYNVTTDESWPRQLGQLTGTTVYNLGVGGYGILQYQQLLDRALKLRPKHLVVGLFVSNDIADVIKLNRENDYWRRWLGSRGITIDPFNIAPPGAEKSVGIGSIVDSVCVGFV